MIAARRIASITAVSLPVALAFVWLTYGADLQPRSTSLTVLGVALTGSALIAWWHEASLRKRLGTVASVLAAYREGDFSIRARNAGRDTALADVLTELNQLGDTLRAHRLGEMEAWALLRKVMAEVDVVVLAIDEDGGVRLANDAAARLLGRSSRELIGEKAKAIGIGELLDGGVPRIVGAGGLGGKLTGPWELRRGAFRLSGEAQTLVVLSDVSRALRDNEREAWRRIIRVMGHEINNSLSPIMSIAGSLAHLVDPDRRREGSDWETDLRDGLGVIARRSEALGRFMTSYATLARLPPPRRVPVPVSSLLTRLATLETRVTVEVIEGPEVSISGDADQLEQALINLVKNAAEASLETAKPAAGGAAGRVAAKVRVRWALENGWVVVAIEDDGPGVGETANLFVPFFTTKPTGSGIGLALSRQIAEAHDGQLSLSSRPDGMAGAIARLSLPVLT